MKLGKIAFGLALLGTAGSMAAATFTISAGGSNGCGGSFGGGFGPESSSSLISDHFNGTCEFGTQSYDAIAGPGVLGGSVANTFFGAGNSSLGSADAQFSGSMIIVDPVTESVGISMNLFLSGSLSIGGSGGGSAIVDLTTPFGQGHWDLVHGSTGAIPIPAPGSSGVVTTPTIFVLTNTPFTLTIDLGLTAGAPFSGFINLDYAHTLSFPSSGPAFNLPPGTTVESPDLNIFGNQWVDPRASQAVPEPASCGVVFGGVLLTIVRRRRLK